MSLATLSTARLLCRTKLQPSSLQARLSTASKNFKPPQSSFLKAEAEAAEAPPPPTSFLDKPAPPPSQVILGLSLLAATATYGYLHTHLGGNESLKRTASFYSLAIPAYLQYRYHMLIDSEEETWEELHKETSLKGLNKILELQGFYVKSGQMAAANIGNAIPPIWQGEEQK